MEYQNVFFDISSIADDTTILKAIATKVKKLIEAVPDRVLYGSDYSGCSKEEHIKFLKNLRLSEDVEQKVLWENANKIFETIM